jgi:hypothetical protein
MVIATSLAETWGKLFVTSGNISFARITNIEADRSIAEGSTTSIPGRLQESSLLIMDEQLWVGASSGSRPNIRLKGEYVARSHNPSATAVERLSNDAMTRSGGTAGGVCNDA